MLIFQVLKTLWAMLDAKKRWAFVGLIGILAIAGLLEMFGMLVLFGYVKGLIPHPDTGHRHGPVAKILSIVFGDLNQLHYVLLGGLVVVLVMSTKHALSTIGHFLLNRFLMKLNERVSRRLFEGYLLARFEIFTKRGVGGPQNNIKRSFDLFSATFGATAQILSDGAIVLMGALLLLVVDPVLTLVGFMTFGVLGALLYRGTRNTLERMGEEERRSAKQTGQYLAEGFHGVLDGRLNNTRGLFVSNYVRALGKTALVQRRKALLNRLPQTMNEVLLALAIIGAVLYLTLRGQSVQEALPTLAIFAFAGLRLTGAMSRVNKGFQKIRQKFGEFRYFQSAVSEVAPELLSAPGVPAAADRYLDDEKPLPKGVDGRLHESLTLQNVTFAYPGAEEPALRDVSLTIARGSFVSFCGESGGGKSTLLLVLMGLMKPQQGEVLCDGRSVFGHVRAWHRGIGYVGQHIYIAARTIRENVAFGLPEEQVNDDQVWEALEKASLADFVRTLPKGLDTFLREGGSRLSGGQRQRIAIARALYKNPEVIIFDEATAALDNVTEREVTESIRKLSGQKTVICVAHRLSTIRDSDTIYYLHGGRIVASGTYDELMESSPEFQRLARATERTAEPSSSTSEPSPGADSGILEASGSS